MQHHHDTQEELLSPEVCPQGQQQQGGFGQQAAAGAQGQLQLMPWCAPCTCILVGPSALALCQPAVQPGEACMCVAGGLQVVAWCLASAYRAALLTAAAPHLVAGAQQELQEGVLGPGR